MTVRLAPYIQEVRCFIQTGRFANGIPSFFDCPRKWLFIKAVWPSVQNFSDS
jgi:hypothetical protein